MSDLQRYHYNLYLIKYELFLIVISLVKLPRAFLVQENIKQLLEINTLTREKRRYNPH